MELFIDSADPEQIKKYGKSGIFKGVTTNPTFMNNYGFSDDITMVRGIQQIFNGEIHVEAIGTNVGEIVDNAHRILEAIMPPEYSLGCIPMGINQDIVFKVPFSEDGVMACRELTSDGLKVSLHLVESVNQALIAANAGANYICILVGRMEDEGGVDGLSITAQILDALRKDAQALDTKVMVSSVRHPIHVSKSWLIGADVITIPPRVIDVMYYHPTTERGMKRFWDDYYGSMLVSTARINKTVLVSPEDTIKTALAKMADQKTSAVIVAASNDELIGIFTMGDFKRLILTHNNPLELSISGVLTGNFPKIIEQSEPISKAREMMIDNEIEQLIVVDVDNDVDNGIKIVGLLQMKDIIGGPRC